MSRAYFTLLWPSPLWFVYIPRFQHLENLLIEIRIIVKNFRQPTVHFQNRLQLLQTVTGFPVAV